MNVKPTPMPEGELIRTALRRVGISVRKAAPQAGLSEGRWRQIVNGYQVVTKGSYVPVKAPPETLAAMARVVRLTPESLTEAGRPDAAEALAELATPADGDSSESRLEYWEHELAAPDGPLRGEEVLRWRQTERGREYRLYEDDISTGHTFGADEEPEEVIDDLRDLLRPHRVAVEMMERRRARR